MDFIPLGPDENLDAILSSFNGIPFKFQGINNQGEIETENIVLRVEEDVESLYDFIFHYEIEDKETGLPEYSKCRLLTFADIELPKGSLLSVYTREGEESTEIGFETGTLHHTVYWGLPSSIWDKPRSSLTILKRTDSLNISPANR